jgi:hypothetical protein
MYHPQFRNPNTKTVYYINFTNKNIKNVEPSSSLKELDNPIITDTMANNYVEYAIKKSKEIEKKLAMEM